MSALLSIIFSETQSTWALSREDEKLHSILRYLLHSEWQLPWNYILFAKQRRYFSVQRACPSVHNKKSPRIMQGKGITPTDWEIYLGFSINAKPNRGVNKTTNLLQNVMLFTKKRGRKLNKSGKNVLLI